jgi:chromosome segregation ATPase
LGKAAERVGVSPEKVTLTLGNNGFHQGERNDDGRWEVTTTLGVSVPGGKTVEAEKLFRAMVDLLHQALVTQAEADIARVAAQVQNAKKEVTEASHELESLYAMRQALQSQAKRAQLSPDLIQAETQAIESQKRQIELDLAGQQARRKAIEEQIAKVGERAQRPSEADQIRRKVLEERLNLVTEEYGQVEKLHEKEFITATELQKARIKIIEAQGELALHHAQMKEQKGEMMEKLNDELVELSIDAAEAEARLNYLREQLAMLQSKELLNLARDYEKLGQAIPGVQDRLERAKRQEREVLARQEQTATPTVTVLGGE